LLREWATVLSDPGLATVLDWWFPRSAPSRRVHAPPPLPADARPDRALAVLRANWLSNGDMLAVDHREAGPSSLVELFARGRPWLAGVGVATEGAAVGRARPSTWLSLGSADVFEWVFRVGRARVTRSAVLLRGRRLALLGEQWDGPGDPGETRFRLAGGVSAAPVGDSRALLLSAGRSPGGVRLFPVGLPRRPYPTERGRFTVEGGEVVLAQKVEPGARRSWRLLVASWDAARDRKAVEWRTLTVAERSRACGPSTAFAARLSWGRNETLVFYRSLVRPGLRSFLGHQTDARYSIGLFSTEGEVEPLVKVMG
jgi:hypothetical protein